MKKIICATIISLVTFTIPCFSAEMTDMIIVGNNYNIDTFLEGTNLQVIFPTERKLHLRRFEATPAGIRFCVSSERGHRLWMRNECYYEDWDMLEYLNVWKRARIIIKKDKNSPYLVFTPQYLKRMVFAKPQ